MGFVHAINPTLLQVGPLEIRFYGIVYALGFLLAFLFLKQAKKKGRLEISEDDIDNFVLYLALGIIVGARLVHVFFWNPGFYLSDPLKILYVWQGGLAFHGGILGGMAVGYWFCKKRGIPIGRMADILVIPAAIALVLGRIANFVNGELWGTVTNVSWCFKFPHAEGCRHPSQIYGAIARTVVLGIVWAVSKKEYKDGYLFWMFFGLMGISRFVVDFFRENARVLGLSLGQWLSLGMVVVTVWVYYKYYKE